MLLFLAPETMAVLSIQWGNNYWSLLVIWLLGSIIIWRARRFHISATYVVSFFLFAFLRSWITGDPWQAELAPITGPMYQLFVFFYDHGSEDHRSNARGPVPSGFLRGAGGVFSQVGSGCICSYFRAFLRWTRGESDRDLAGLTRNK